MKPLSLYIHIPFCVKKCLYCDFPSYGGCENVFEDYVSSLISEIKETKSNFSQYEIKSVFLGGGTPSILPPKFTGKIMDTVFNSFNIANDAEITTEANPKTVDEIKLREYKAMDINRISFGVQAWQNNILKSLGRIHTIDDFIKNMAQARDIGFKNINADIMFALPNQTLSDWEETLEKIMKLNLEHISAYSLIIEDGTPFGKMYDEGKLKTCDEALDREMYYLAKEMMRDKGYHQYEISNFAKEGFECYHNKVYWKCDEYMGYGLGAHSYFNGERFNNTYDMDKYISSKGLYSIIKENREKLEITEMYGEFMFMGLRMTEGISKERFFEKFGKTVYDIYKNEIEYLKDMKLIKETESNIMLTDRGIDVSNTVFEKFII